jgi:hypothetical protein
VSLVVSRPRIVPSIGDMDVIFKDEEIHAALARSPVTITQRELMPLNITLPLLPVDAPDQRFIDYGVIIFTPVGWRFSPFDAV